MKFRLLGFALLLAILFGGCRNEPTRYYIYGICYSEDNTTPLKDATLAFNVGLYDVSGTTKTDAEGHFAFFFWDDGLGQIQNGAKGSIEVETPDDEDDEFHKTMLVISHNGDKLCNCHLWRVKATTTNPLRLHKGHTVTDNDFTTNTKGGAQ